MTWEEQEAWWREKHKDDPCVTCGTKEGVEIIPFGSLGKLTPMCRTCRATADVVLKAYQQGMEMGRKLERSKSWWERLWTRRQK